jgi:hypothetical protein
MPQYAVLIYEREVPAGPEDIPPELLEAYAGHDDVITELGGKVLAAVALDQPTTATAIRGDMLTDGPFVETKEAVAGLYVIEARDLDHALAIARTTPTVDGGVEVRPMVGFQAPDS